MTHNETKPLLLSSKNLDALQLLRNRPNGVVGESSSSSYYYDKSILQEARVSSVIFPWMFPYRVWWTLTALAAICTMFSIPFQIAFSGESGHFNDVMDTLEHLLTAIFIVDIVVNFNLAVYNQEILVFERPKIIQQYIYYGTFWLDLIGVLPWETIALSMTDHPHDTMDSANLLLFSLFRLLSFVRLYRMEQLSHMIQYDARVSLLWFTLLRNFAAVWALTHLEACSMYFLARLHHFDSDTWLGSSVDELSGFQRYITALYLSIVTFCTVGYGDFSPKNSTEQLTGSIFMLMNVAAAAWIIGSITLLIVKGDEKTGEYRENIQVLQQYCEMNHFDEAFADKLRVQMRLEFNNREVCDEQVLKHFPSTIRRKILRKLYLQPLVQTQLMHGIRPQFVDAFLAACTVEIFSPGEEIVERGSISSDLFLLVGGVAQITTGITGTARFQKSEPTSNIHPDAILLQTGDFIGDIGFFTDSPQIDSVTCLILCKTLTISQAAYKLLAQDHPSSAGKVLKNLLKKVESQQVVLPKRLEVLRAGSTYDIDSVSSNSDNNYDSMVDIEAGLVQQRRDTKTAVADLVKLHMDKQIDDQTTRLLFAASRGDTKTIALMCDQGFDPNNADYDRRTALMVASMKGNTDVVRLLLEYKADPNAIDMHGSTALLEAVKNGNEVAMDLLLENGAQLCMPNCLAASVLCQSVFDGDIVLLKRLLKAGIQVNAADYDIRTAAHIAAAEGNTTALRILASHGADLSLVDRWGNLPCQESQDRKSNGSHKDTNNVHRE